MMIGICANPTLMAYGGAKMPGKGRGSLFARPATSAYPDLQSSLHTRSLATPTLSAQHALSEELRVRLTR